jgi:hypothetical protein
VKAIGDGKTKDTAFRPNLPDGTPFVGIYFKGYFLIASSVDLADTTDIKKQVSEQQIEQAAISRGYTLEDVKKWFVGGIT